MTTELTESALELIAPWAKRLPPEDRRQFVAELEQLLREWRASAEVHADPDLSSKLQGPLVAQDIARRVKNAPISIYARDAATRWVRVRTLGRTEAEVNAVLEHHSDARIVAANALGTWIGAGPTFDALPEGACVTIRPDQMGGVPCLRALRVPVVTIARMVAQGTSYERILGDYPDLGAGDIDVAVAFAQQYDIELGNAVLRLVVPQPPDESGGN